MKTIVMHTDGGARGNPGPAGIGAVLKDAETGKVLAEISEYIGEATNNVAEYKAVIAGLEKAKELSATEVRCFLDSLLVVEQLKQNYKVKDANLATLFVKAWNLIQGFTHVTFTHIERAKNKHADRLVNEALDKHVR